MTGQREEREVLVWVGPHHEEQVTFNASSVCITPLESGLMEDGRRYCIWEMPERTLAAHARMAPYEGYQIWEKLCDAGILNSGFEMYPFEIVLQQGEFKALVGRSVFSIPPSGTVYAPERLMGAPVTEKSRVFMAAAWFLYIISGQYPIGIPTPASWKKKNLDTLDEVLFAALRTEPSRRLSMTTFEKRLQETVVGPSLSRWIFEGMFWILGAALLIAWAAGLFWIVTHFELL